MNPRPNKKQKINNYNPERFNNIAACNYINKSILPSEINKKIHSFLINEHYAKQEWKNKIASSLSLIDKCHHWVPVYYFNNGFHQTNIKIVPCTECYLNAFLTKKINPLICVTCEIFQLCNGILIGEREINIDYFNYYESIIPNCPKVARILLQSNKFMAENVLEVLSSGIISTKLEKNQITYHILYNPPLLKKTN